MVSKITKIDDFLNKNAFLLIVGWNKVKKLYPNQKITEKQISENISWTFSEKEKRGEYERDIIEFNKKCIDNFGARYKYYFINPFELKYSTTKKIIKKITDSKDKIGYFNNRHFFILVDDVVLAIDIEFTKIINLSDNKINLWLKSKKVKFIENFDILNIDEHLINKEYLIPPIQKEKDIYDKEFTIGYILN